MIFERLRVICLLGVMYFFSAQVFAQQLGSSDLLDAEQAFQIAKQASEAGDFQTAIIALERVLVISPGLANIQFELGLLYKRVGAPRRAEFFLRESLKSDEMPAEIRQRAVAELSDLTDTASAGVFSASLGLQLRHETNPNAFSDTGSVFDPIGQSFVIGDSMGSEEADGSTQLSLAGNYRRRFGAGAQHQWNAGISFLTTNYFEQERFDSAGLTFNGGATYDVASSSSTLNERAGPYIYYTLGQESGEQNFATVGAGVRLSKSSRLWSASASLEGNSQAFDDEEIAETSDENQTVVRLNFRFRANESSRATFGISTGFTDARSASPFNSYTSRSINLTASYPLSVFESAPGASVTLSIGTRDRNHDTLNPFVSDTTIREDDSPFVGASLRVPFSSGFGFNAGIRLDDNRSSLPNFRYTNTTAQLGVSWRY